MFLTEHFVCFSILQFLPLFFFKSILKSHMEGCWEGVSSSTKEGEPRASVWLM